MKTLKSTLLLLLACSIAIPMQAYDFKFEGICYKINSDGTTVYATYEQKGMPSYSFIPLEIDFPSKVTFGGKTYTVTAIGDSAFWGCDVIMSFTLSPTIKSIGDKAFYNCQGIKNIYIPPTVRDMQTEVFAMCKSLQHACLNHTPYSSYLDGSDNMGWGIFNSCTALESVTIGPNIKKMTGYEFSNCTNLSEVICLGDYAPTAQSSSFNNISKDKIYIHVPVGCKSSYLSHGWTGFSHIYEDLPAPSDKGDLNTDGKVNVSDVATLINIILGIN